MRIEFAAKATATAAPQTAAARAISNQSTPPATALASLRHADSIQLQPETMPRNSASATTATGPIGAVVAAVLHQIAAMLVLLGQINQNGKEQEAAEKERGAGLAADPLRWVASSTSPKGHWDDRD